MKVFVTLLVYFHLAVLTACAQRPTPRPELPRELKEEKAAKELKEPRERPDASADLWAELLASKIDPMLNTRIGEAQRLTDARNWNGALEILTATRGRCGKLDFECSSRVDYATGYLYQVWYQAEKNKDHQQKAIEAYESALKADESYAACYYNLALAYRSDGDVKKAISTLLRATEQGIDDYLELLADLQISTKNYEGAISTYRDIVEKRPMNQRAVRRLADLYSRVDASFGTVATLCKNISTIGMNEIARNTLSDYMRRAYAELESRPVTSGVGTDSNAELKKSLNDALLWWTNLSARTETFDVESLPSDWKVPSILLLKNIDRSIRFYREDAWWTSDAEVKITEGVVLKPRSVLASMIDYLGHRYLGYDSVEMADRAYTIAFDLITNKNPYQMVNRQSPPDEFYQIAGHRAMFYTAYPEYPQAEDKFKRLEGILLDGKSEQYMRGNSAAILKYHTTLGTLYAARGQWRGRAFFDNGIFQLERAIQKSSYFQNTGHLKELLAEGYNETNERVKARDTLLSAGISYLNEDDFESTSRVLQQYRAFDGTENEIFRTLSSVYKFRSDLESGKFSTKDSVTVAIAMVDRLTSGTATPKSFRQLQKFKMLTGMANAYAKSENEGASEYLYASALLESRAVSTFPSMLDVDRLTDCIASVKKSTPSPWLSPVITEGQKGAVQGWKTWKIAGISVVDRSNVFLQCSVLDAPMLSSGVVSKSLSVETMRGSNATSKSSRYLKHYITIGADGTIGVQNPNAQLFAYTTLTSASDGARALVTESEFKKMNSLIAVLK